jgi:glycosyltransferase involved in cell wall biosynthesis
VYPAFEFLAPTIKLTVVGATHNADDGRINELVWSYDVQAAALSRARVGVAPQALDAWSQRKAFYKVLEYLAASVVPVVPAHPAVRTLLGDELEIVAVTAQHETPAAWAAAITIALSIDIDEQWTAARERIFEKWSPDRLGRVMVGEEIS